MHVQLRIQIGAAVTLRNSEIESLEITQELSAHTRCRLRFMRDRDTDVHLDALMGQPLVVTLQDDTGLVTAFTGTVVEGSQGHQINHGSEVILEGMSPSWSLERVQTAYYTANKLGDIVRGEYKGWADVILRNVDMQKFPLKWATLLGIESECVFFSDHDRSKSTATQ